MLRGANDFSAFNRVKKASYRFVVMSYVKSFEIVWFQHKIGALRESDWKASTVDLHSFFLTPSAHAAWPLVKNRFNA